MKHLSTLLISVAILAACSDESIPPAEAPEPHLIDPPQATADASAPIDPGTAPPPASQAKTAPARADIDVPNVNLGDAAGSAGFYVVEPGDTLYSIAREHDIVYADLVRWNNIDNPDHIWVGQQIRVTRDTDVGGASLGNASPGS